MLFGCTTAIRSPILLHSDSSCSDRCARMRSRGKLICEETHYSSLVVDFLALLSQAHPINPIMCSQFGNLHTIDIREVEAAL